MKLLLAGASLAALTLTAAAPQALADGMPRTGGYTVGAPRHHAARPVAPRRPAVRHAPRPAAYANDGYEQGGYDAPDDNRGVDADDGAYDEGAYYGGDDDHGGDRYDDGGEDRGDHGDRDEEMGGWQGDDVDHGRGYEDRTSYEHRSDGGRRSYREDYRVTESDTGWVGGEGEVDIYRGHPQPYGGGYAYGAQGHGSPYGAGGHPYIGGGYGDGARIYRYNYTPQPYSYGYGARGGYYNPAPSYTYGPDCRSGAYMNGYARECVGGAGSSVSLNGGFGTSGVGYGVDGGGFVGGGGVFFNGGSSSFSSSSASAFARANASAFGRGGGHGGGCRGGCGGGHHGGGYGGGRGH